MLTPWLSLLSLSSLHPHPAVRLLPWAVFLQGGLGDAVLGRSVLSRLIQVAVPGGGGDPGTQPGAGQAASVTSLGAGREACRPLLRKSVTLRQSKRSCFLVSVALFESCADLWKAQMVRRQRAREMVPAACSLRSDVGTPLVVSEE